MKRLMLIFSAVMVSACVTLSATAEPVAFRLQQMNSPGGQYDSGAHVGKPIVIEFFHEWCGPCNQNSANVKAMANEWHGERAQVIEVGLDCSDRDFADWIARHSPTFPVLKDCDGDALARSLGVSSYPTTIVLDKNHVRLWATTGVWSSAKKARIKALLTEQTQALE